jgi:signal peptidase I
MPFTGKRRSFAEAVESRRKVAGRLGLIVVVFAGYQIISGLFLSSYAAGSATMAPAMLPGELFLATPLPFGPRTLFGKLPGLAKPQRGDILLTLRPYAAPVGFWTGLVDSVLRFLSFQRFSLEGRNRMGGSTGPVFLRVVGIPGDSIRMEDFVFQVRPRGQLHFLTEFELSAKRYDSSGTALPALWRAEFPASAHMSERLLADDEYFLAGDSRGFTGDSRLWGPVRQDRFLAKALFRYWPLSRFGPP